MSDIRPTKFHFDDVAVLIVVHNSDWLVTCARKFKTEQQPSEIFAVLRHLYGFFTG